MGAWLWNTKAFTHKGLDLEDVLVIFKVESMRETCQSLVVLNCEHYFLAFSVPVFLEKLLIKFNRFWSFKHSAYSQVFIVKILLHACANCIMPLHIRSCVASYKEVLSNIMDTSAWRKAEIWVRSLNLKDKSRSTGINGNSFKNLSLKDLSLILESGNNNSIDYSSGSIGVSVGPQPWGTFKGVSTVEELAYISSYVEIKYESSTRMIWFVLRHIQDKVIKYNKMLALFYSIFEIFSCYYLKWFIKWRFFPDVNLVKTFTHD